MNYKEVYDISVPQKKRKEERWNVFTAYVLRPISILLTMPFIKTSLKPTTITEISVLFCIIGFIFAYFGNDLQMYVVSWTFFFLWAIFDCIDGNLARCTNQCSSLGDLWDTTGGYAAMVLMYFSAGIIAFKDTNLYDYTESYQYIVLGGMTAIMSIFPRLVMHKKKSSEAASGVVKQLSDKNTFGLSKILAMNLVSPTGGLLVIYLLSVIFHVTNIFIAVYAFVNFAIMMVSLKGLLKE